MATIKPNELASYLKKRVDDSSKKTFAKWQDKAGELLKAEIEARLDDGKSPVEGEGSFQKYSESYKKKIKAGSYGKYNKQTSPVNLKLSGKMRLSAKVRKTKDGISFWLSSAIAKYHNGKGRVDRLIYPTRQGQKFARPIREKLAKLYVRLFKIKI